MEAFLSQSQNREDELIWKLLGRPESGLIVEVGAFDGRHLSNSFTLERIGWKAICIEADPFFYSKLIQNRSTAHCLNYAIVGDPKVTQVEFKREELGLLSGISVDEADIRTRYQKRALKFKGLHTEIVQATTLNQVFKKYNIRSIDAITIDTEGTELDVLDGIDFNIYRPRIIIVESNSDQNTSLLTIKLEKQQYRFYCKVGDNLVFIVQSLDANPVLLNAPIFIHSHPLGERFTAQPIRVRPTSTVLFYKLLSKCLPSLILEIGSRDGLDAIKIKDNCPSSDVMSFEANFESFEYTSRIIQLSGLNIEIFNCALSNESGTAKFYIYDKPGLGSLELRNDLEPQKVIDVEIDTLDKLLVSRKHEFPSIAMWIDVEGHGLPVLEGAAGILDQVDFILMEVEVYKVFKYEKQTRKYIKKYLSNKGFKELQFSGHGKVAGEVRVGDSIFINKSVIKDVKWMIYDHMFWSFLINSKIALYEWAENYLPFLIKIWKKVNGS